MDDRRWKIYAGHPIVDQQMTCSRCGKVFVDGDECYLDEEGPASDQDAALKAAGRAYTAMASPAHWRCHPTQGRTIGGS